MELVIHGRVVLTSSLNRRPWSYICLAEYPPDTFGPPGIRLVISDLHSKFALGPRHVSKYGRHPICGRWD